MLTLDPFLFLICLFFTIISSTVTISYDIKKSIGKCPKISYTKVSDKMAYANSADLDKNTP